MQGRKAIKSTEERLLARRKITDSGCWEWQGKINGRGYGAINVKVGGERKTQVVHRVMFSVVHGDIPPGMMILHTCDNRPCFNPGHLYAGDQAANMADMVKRGRSTPGEKHASSKLTTEEVTQIRVLRKDMTQQGLADKFSVSRTQIRSIISYRGWKHLPPPGSVPFFFW